MTHHPYPISRITPCIFVLLTVILNACASATPTPIPLPTETATLTLAPTATFTPTAIRTPPALPSAFQTAYLNPHDTPHAYLTDTCLYLRDKWASTSSAPGTVAMVIMFHSIVARGDTPTDYNQIGAGEFEALMGDLYEQGFQAIKAQQLADFLYHNAKIPLRSVVLIVDDRHYAQYFNTYFRPYYEQWGWPVVNAWIGKDDATGAAALPDNAALEAEGWVDHQAHGFIHNILISEYSSDDFILGELNGAMQAIQQNFGKTPIAYIWPLGGFTPHAAELARRSGYLLGFTINPRGPLMFNWVPLSDASDPMRPSYIPEGPVDDPLMVLPRYWSYDADKHIDEVRLIGREAAAYAEANKAVELEYYDIVCTPTYGPIP